MKNWNKKSNKIWYSISRYAKRMLRRMSNVISLSIINWISIFLKRYQIHPKLRNINPHNVTHSLTSQNPREWMFLVQISLLIIKFLFLISQGFSWIQTIKEVNPHSRIAPCFNRWSVFLFLFLFLCHLLNCWCWIYHIVMEGQVGCWHVNMDHVLW